MNRTRQVRCLTSVDEKSSVERMQQEQSSVLEGEGGGLAAVYISGYCPLSTRGSPTPP